MDATAAAQDPVPEDAVWPTPRSQKRTSISRLEITLTNSTFVRLGKCGWTSSSRPMAFQSTCSKSGTKREQWGFPMEVIVAHCLPCEVERGEGRTGGEVFRARNGI